MIPRFIVVGPIDGLYHVCYRIPCTMHFSSYETMESQTLAEQRASQLNTIESAEQELG